MKLRTELIISFLMLSIMIGVVGIWAIISLNTANQSIKNISEEIQNIAISSELDSHAQSIRYYDEVLTQSARNFAFTQDKIWEERYREFEPLLDEKVNQALSIGDKSLSQLFKNIDVVNKKLVELEYRSIELVNEGKFQEAITVLQSKEYKNNKLIYENELRKYVETKGIEYNDVLITSTVNIEKSTQDILENIIFSLNILYIFSPVLILISIIFGLVISNSITNPIKKLADISYDISKGNFKKQILVSGSDEIKNLSESFNEMSQSIQKIVKLEKELTRAEEKIKSERFSVIGELSARIAHDLRNPLSVVKNTVELMKISYKDPDENTLKHFLRLENSILRMSHQIEDVLDYVKPKSLVLENHSLLAILNSTLERIRKPDTVTINLPENNANLTCDSEKLEIVFINLITNAIQAINHKGTINIRVSEQSEYVLIEVEDNGPGIPDDLLPKIFDPLFTTRQIGTGLGLPSCKNIIEKHGGMIDVKTVLGQGTTFIIKLPKKALN